MNSALICVLRFLTSLISPSLALAQFDESGDVAKVVKQKSCTVLIRGSSNLKVKQNVTLILDNGSHGFGVVSKFKSDGSLMVNLANQFCKIDFVGAVVAIAAARSSRRNKDEFSSGALLRGVEVDSSAHGRLNDKNAIRLGAGFMFAPGFTVANARNASHLWTFKGTLDYATLDVLSIYRYQRLRIGMLTNYFGGNSFYTAFVPIFERFTSGFIV
jgi:hypothetical protein